MTDTESAPLVSDHFRTDGGGGYDPGTYRVVGVTGQDVTLLKVTDGRGRRRATGAVVTVTNEDIATAFEPARNPDAGFDPVSSLRNALTGLVWQVRSLTGL